MDKQPQPWVGHRDTEDSHCTAAWKHLEHKQMDAHATLNIY